MAWGAVMHPVPPLCLTQMKFFNYIRFAHRQAGSSRKKLTGNYEQIYFLKYTKTVI